jgi:hypothetical protein
MEGLGMGSADAGLGCLSNPVSRWEKLFVVGRAGTSAPRLGTRLMMVAAVRNGRTNINDDLFACCTFVE